MLRPADLLFRYCQERLNSICREEGSVWAETGMSQDVHGKQDERSASADHAIPDHAERSQGQ